MELRHLRLAVLSRSRRRLEEFRQPVPDHSLPLRHLHRMHLILTGNLAHRFNPHQRFQSHLGLEGSCMPFAFCFAHSSAGFSCPAEPEKSNLTTGPIFGVHFNWVVTDSEKAVNSRHADAVSRFWTLFVATQRGVLANYSSDFASTFNNAVRGSSAAPLAASLDGRDTEVTMHSAALVAGMAAPTEPRIEAIYVTNIVTATNVVTKVVTNIVSAVERSVIPTAANGNTGFGLVWGEPNDGEQDVDLDLHVVAPHNGVELYFAVTNSTAGRFYRHIRHSTARSTGDWKTSWEFIELYGDQLPREAWINLYEGCGPVHGELRVQYHGQLHRIAFTFPAVKGDKGEDSRRRTKSEHWLRIDLQSLVAP